MGALIPLNIGEKRRKKSLKRMNRMKLKAKKKGLMLDSYLQVKYKSRKVEEEKEEEVNEESLFIA